MQPENWAMWLIVSPLAMTLAYGSVRVLMALLTQWRDGIFAKVAMHAVRRLAYRTFVHMHELSLRFHLERKTGGLTRVLERGRNGIEEMVRLVILQLVPTAVEVGLLIGRTALAIRLALRSGDAGDCHGLHGLHLQGDAMAYRNPPPDERLRLPMPTPRRSIRFLNYETVKYFSAEMREAKRYDRSMERFETASVQTYTSLAVLNAGQAVIYTAGLTAVMIMCALGVRNGTHTVGDFVMVNAMMIQLYQPLNLMGMVYREIKQAIIDIEKMFAVLTRRAEVQDRAGAQPLRIEQGSVRFEDVRFAYDPDRPILKGLTFDVPAGKTVAIVGPSGAGKSTHVEVAVPPL